MLNPSLVVEEKVILLQVEDNGLVLAVDAPAEIQLVIGAQGPPGPPGAGLTIVDGGEF